MTRIFFASLIFLSLSLGAQVKIGTGGDIEPVGSFAAMKMAVIEGGYHVLDDTTDLPDYLKPSAVVLQLSDTTVYFFDSPNWVEIPGGSGGTPYDDTAINDTAAAHLARIEALEAIPPFSKNPSDLNPEGATAGQIMKYDGSNWVPADDTTGGGGTTETVSAGTGTIVNKVGNDYEVAIDEDEVAKTFKKTEPAQYYCIDGMKPIGTDSSYHASEGTQVVFNDTLRHYYRYEYGGSHIGNNAAIYQRYSVNGGGNWSEPIPVFDSVDVDDRNILAVVVDGVVVIWFRMYDATTSTHLSSGYITSINGRDFSAYNQYTNPSDTVLIPFGKKIVIGDTSYISLYGLGHCEWVKSVNGTDWSHSRVIYTGEGLLIEPYIETIGSDTLIGLIRQSSSGTRTYQINSITSGVTWTSPFLTNLGASTVVTNPAAIHYDERTKQALVVQMSRSRSETSTDSLAVYNSNDIADAMAGQWNKVADINLRFSNFKQYGYPNIIQFDDYYNVVITQAYLGVSRKYGGQMFENAALYDFKIYLDSTKTNQCAETVLESPIKRANKYTGIVYNTLDNNGGITRNLETGEIVMTTPDEFITYVGGGNDSALVFGTGALGGAINAAITNGGKFKTRTEGSSTDWWEAYERGDFRDFGLARAITLSGADMDTLNDNTSFYYVASPVNAPTSDNYYLMNIKSSNTSISRQVAFRQTAGAGGNDIYTRRTVGAAWVKLLSTEDGNFFSGNPSDINQEGATTGQVIKWNGSQWAPANDSGGSAGTNNPDSVAGEPGAYYLDYDNFVNTPSIPNISNYYTSSQTDSIKQFVVDSLGLELDKLHFIEKEVTTTRSIDATDAWRTLSIENDDATLTIPDNLGMDVGTKIILQSRFVGLLEMAAGTGVILNNAAAGTGTMEIESTANGVKTRVMQYIGDDGSGNDVYTISNE